MSFDSFVRLERADGTFIDDELRAFIGPYDFEPPPVSGRRAPDSKIVHHTGDRLPTTFAYTITGTLSAVTPDALEALYWKLKRELKTVVRVWRGPRYFECAYGVMGGGTPRRGETSVDIAIVFAISRLAWFDANGLEVS